jgi:hypothetical protein
MTTDFITTEAFKEQFQKLKEAHFQKLKDIIYQVPLN